MGGRLQSWVRNVLGREGIEDDLADELRFHLDERTDHWRRQGLPADEARRRARVEFGSIERYKDDCRQSLGLRLLDDLITDVSHAARRLFASPGFTAVAVTILAVALGASIAVFSVLETVMLKTLPVDRPQDLRELAWVQSPDAGWKMRYEGSTRPGGLRTSFSYAIYEHLQAHSTTFSDLVLFTDARVTARVNESARRASALLVSGTFLRGLGVRMSAGRPLLSDDDADARPPTAVVSHDFWQRALGGQPNVLGTTLTINNISATIVGVADPAFFGVDPGSTVDVFLPLSIYLTTLGDMAGARAKPDVWAFRMMGRVARGADDQQVATETEALVRQGLPPQFASNPSGLARVAIMPAARGSDYLRRNYSSQLYLLLTIMLTVLLIASGNVAGLMLARTASRTQEMALRLALGAARSRLVRQLLTESVLVTFLATTLAVVLAFLVRGSILPLIAEEGDELSLALRTSVWLAAFVFGVGLTVGLLIGILPALRATGSAARVDSMRRMTGTSGRLFAGKTLIALQVALSLVLVASAGLFVRTLHNLRAEPLGFRADGVLLFQLDATASGYSAADANDFYEHVRERLVTTPGVESASISRYGLVSGGATTDTIVIPGSLKEVDVHVHFVSEHHLETFRIPLLAGRDLSNQDRAGRPRVALVNAALARLLPDATSAVGSRILRDAPDAPIEIVGVAGNARFASLREQAPPTLYLPYHQYPQQRMTFSVRTAADPTALSGPIRQTIEAIDPKVPVSDMRTQEAQIDEAVRPERTFALVASGFGLLALVLACLGVYGTLAYAVSRRRAEIGVRIALGASRSEIVHLVIRESLTPTVIGVAAGLGTAALTTRYLAGMLYGLTPRDPVTLAVSAIALIASALVAAWIPSRRAASVDPITALRAE